MGRMMGFPIGAPASRMNTGDSEDTASARTTLHGVSPHPAAPSVTRMDTGFQPNLLSQAGGGSKGCPRAWRCAMS